MLDRMKLIAEGTPSEVGRVATSQSVDERAAGREGPDLLSSDSECVAEWCNGNTADFGSVVPGSNPGSAAGHRDRLEKPHHPDLPRYVDELEARVSELEAKLGATQAALAEAQRQLDSWLSLVSHDLRGPLTLILGYADSLFHHLTPRSRSERLGHDLEAIVIASRRLNKMLGQVVDGARLEARRLTLNPQLIDIGVVLKEEARKARRLYKDNSIRTDIPDSLPSVVADGRRVGQIIATLLSNAAVFSPASAPIRVAARRKGDRIVLSVADHGIGLSAEEQQDVFQKYFQTERSRAARREGLGVSLAIAKGLATELGGDLRVESPGPDCGSTFFFCLPIER